MRILLLKDIESPYKKGKILKAGMSHDFNNEIAREWVDKKIAKPIVRVQAVTDKIEKRKN
jgi:hypothetical protein